MLAGSVVAALSRWLELDFRPGRSWVWAKSWPLSANFGFWKGSPTLIHPESPKMLDLACVWEILRDFESLSNSLKTSLNLSKPSFWDSMSWFWYVLRLNVTQWWLGKVTESQLPHEIPQTTIHPPPIPHHCRSRNCLTRFNRISPFTDFGVLPSATTKNSPKESSSRHWFPWGKSKPWPSSSRVCVPSGLLIICGIGSAIPSGEKSCRYSDVHWIVVLLQNLTRQKEMERWKKLSTLDVPSLELYYWFPSIWVAPKQDVNITCRTHDECRGPLLPLQEYQQQQEWESEQQQLEQDPGRCLKGLQTTTLQHESKILMAQQTTIGWSHLTTLTMEEKFDVSVEPLYKLQ